MDAKVNNTSIQALINTGSTKTFINHQIVWQLEQAVTPVTGSGNIASSSLSSEISGTISVDLMVDNKAYLKVKLVILHDLCCNNIMSHDFLQQHSCVSILFEGLLLKLTVHGLTAINIQSPSLFTHLSPNCKPITEILSLFKCQENVYSQLLK